MRGNDMTLGQAWQAAREGKAIARRAWAGRRPALRITAWNVPDPLGGRLRPDVAAGADLDGEDLAAGDWFIVLDA